MYNDGEDKKRVMRDLPSLPESVHKTGRLVVDHPLYPRNIMGSIPTSLRDEEAKKTNHIATISMNAGRGGGGGGDGGVNEEVKEWVEGWMMGWEDVSTLLDWNYDEFESYDQYLVLGDEDYGNGGDEEIVWECHDIWD